MPALTSASTLSVNPKRGEAGTGGAIRRLIHALVVNTDIEAAKCQAESSQALLMGVAD